MATIGSLSVVISAKTAEFEAAMRKMRDRMAQVEQRFEGLTAVGQEFTAAGAKIAASGAAIGVGLGAAVKSTMDFDKAMSRVKALSGATDADFERLRATAKELGATTAFSASQAAEGMQYLAMAGYETNEIIEAMPGLLSMAAAGQVDLGTTADIASDILSAFGLTADQTARVADVLTKTFTSSNTSLEMLGETMKYVAPVASAAGLSLEEMSAAAGLLGDIGIKASQAGTALRAIILRLIDPPKEAAERLAQLGISITDAEGKMRPMADIIGQVRTALADKTEAEKAAIASTIAGTEASAAFLGLIEAGPEKIRAFTRELENSGGTADRVAKEQLDNLTGQLTILRSGIEGMAIAIGDALVPYISRLAGWIQGLVDRFNALPEPVKKGIAIFAALSAGLAVVGGSMLMFTGLVMQGIAGIAKLGAAFSGVGAIVSKLPAAFAALTPPAGLIIAAVVAFAGLVYLIIKNWEPIKEFFLNLWESVKEIFASTWDAIQSKVNTAWEAIKSTAETVWNAIKEFFKRWGQDLLLIAVGPAGWAVLLAQKLGVTWDDIKTALTNTWNAIKNTAADIWDAIADMVKGAINGIIEMINHFIRAFNRIEIRVPEVEIPLIGTVGGWTIKMPQIPEIPLLARGGIVMEPTLAILGEAGPEAVVPLPGSIRATGDIHLHFTNCKFSSEEEYRRFESWLVRRLDRLGVRR